MKMHTPSNPKYTSLLRKFFFFSSLSIIISLVNTGCAPKFADAQRLFDQGYFGQAAVAFENVSRSESDKKIKEKALMLSAEAYRLNNNYTKAKKTYERVLKTDPNNTQALLMRANMMKKLEMYRDAVAAYENYLEKVPGDSAVMQKMMGCEMAIQWTPDSSLFKVENFKVANTRSNDWAPMIASKKDDVLFFASDREGGFSKRVYEGTLEMWSDIWFIEGKATKGKVVKPKKGKAAPAAATEVVKWEKPKYSPKNSTKYNEGGVTFNDRYSQMYVTQCGGSDGKSEKCAIYEYKKQGPDWIIGDVLDICKKDTGHSYGHPALGDEDKLLFFSSDREGGFGGFDIWVVTYSKRSRTWGNPVNLGPSINSKGNEYFPYFNKHDKRLYFSSDYWPGLGGLDMFAAEMTEDITKWRDLENLREPLNSGGDDFAITFSEKNPNKGFFTSNRGDKKNDDDIYAFDIVPLVITIRGVVTDCNTKKPLENATVVLSNDKDTSVLILKTNSNGEYSAKLNPKTNYELVAKYPELYYFDIPPVTRTTHGIRFSTELEQDFCLVNPLDKIYALPIFYDLDSANIRPDAAKILDTFAQDVMIRYPRLVAELGSHTDCRASVDYNTKLAQRRADNAKKYLMSRWNIDSSRIKAVGFGETELINDCKCEGAEKTGYTPYRRDTTRKMVVIKDDKGNVVRSYYTKYSASEIVSLEGKPFVPCDEFQHQQNRRTSVRFEFGGQKSRVKVNQDVDINNTNAGSSTLDSTAKITKGKNGDTPSPESADLENAIRVQLSGSDKKSIPAMINGKEPQMFQYDFNAKTNMVPPDIAAQWFQAKIITKKDFVEGDKFKVGKVKLPSNKFVVEDMMIGDYPVKGVQFSISDKVESPILGKSVLQKYFKTTSYATDKELILIPKKAIKKPKAPKPPRAPKTKAKSAKDKDAEEVAPEK